MKKKLLTRITWSAAVLCLTSGQKVSAQISPPGLGRVNTAAWFAAGLRQNLDTATKTQSVTYFGLGSTSTPDDYNPFNRSAIRILNQEFYHDFHKKWQYSLAISLRRQNEYEEREPYRVKSPAFRDEFRIYGRFSNIYKSGKWKWTNTFRQEMRRFYGPGSKPASEDLEFRSRLRSQFAYSIDEANRKRVILSAEALFSSRRQIRPEEEWEPFGYKETRICLYYSFMPGKIPFVINAGYMNNLVGSEEIISGQYLALDVIWENPFGHPRHILKKATELLE